MKAHLIFWLAKSHAKTYCGLRLTRLDRGVADSEADATCRACLREFWAVDFTRADHKKALAQGWLLGEHSIERDDDTKRFADDDTAAAYVVGRAEAGCELARRALRYYGKKPRRRINGTLVMRAAQ